MMELVGGGSGINGANPVYFFGGGGKILQARSIAFTYVEWSPIKENLNKNMFFKDNTVNFTLIYNSPGSKQILPNERATTIDALSVHTFFLSV